MGARAAAAPLTQNSFSQLAGLIHTFGMKTLAFTYWQDGEAWLGHLDEFPDYLTQGETFDDLKAHLADLHRDLTSGDIPCVRHHAELELA